MAVTECRVFLKKHIRQQQKPQAKEKTTYLSGEGESAVQQMLTVDPPSEALNQKILSRIQENPEAAKMLMDPRMSWILEGLQKKPQETIKILGLFPGLQQVFKIACEVVGEQVEAKEAQLSRPSLNPKVKAVLDQPGVAEAMMDPQVQSLVEKARQREHNQIHCILKEAEPDLKAKIRLLLEHKLLSLSS